MGLAVPHLGNLSWRAVKVWRRNAMVYRMTWWSNLLPPLLEPILYFLALGTGVGALVGEVPYQGRSIPYLPFIAAGLLAMSVLFSAVFETSYGSFVRMYYQRTFDAILATPLELEDVLLGEILWGATKAVIGSAVMLGVIAAFGVLAWPGSLWVVPLAILGGFLFASMGLCFTALCPTIDTFNLPTFLVVLPMFLFSGTFFPLDVLPDWAAAAGRALPLTHLTALLRSATLGLPAPDAAGRLVYLVGLSAGLFVLSLALMRRRLIR